MKNLDKKKIHALILEVKRVAETASLTGCLKGGTPILLSMYNQCLDAIQAQGDDCVGKLMPQLKDDASMDSIGVAAAMLAAYLAPEFHHEYDFKERVIGQRLMKHVDDFIANAPCPQNCPHPPQSESSPCPEPYPAHLPENERVPKHVSNPAEIPEPAVEAIEVEESIE